MGDKLQKNEIASILGLTKPTLRYYEQIGLIKPTISENNYRGYGIEELKQLAQIQFLRSINIDIKTIKTIFIEKNDLKLKEILIKKKIDLENLVSLYSKNIKKIDQIIDIENPDNKSNNFQQYKKKEIEERFLYQTTDTFAKHSLSQFYKFNKNYFKNGRLQTGEWFIVAVDTELFRKNGFESSAEYILSEKENEQNSKVIKIPKGTYACFDIIIDSDEEISLLDTFQHMVNLQLNRKILRKEKILIVNNDNLNFNFNETKRYLTIQVPIKD